MHGICEKLRVRCSCLQRRTCSKLFVMSSSAVALPIPGLSSCPSSRTKCGHAAFCWTAFASPDREPSLRNHPLIQNTLAHSLPHTRGGWHESDGSLSSRCLGNQEVDQSLSAQARSGCVQHRSAGQCNNCLPFSEMRDHVDG